MEISRFKNRLIGILRGYNADDALFAAETAKAAGVDIFEVAIRRKNEREDLSTLFTLRKYLPDEVLVGAGTVLDLRTLNAAERCGASFIVSPGLVRDLTALCVSRSIPVIPGALTPTEMIEAYNLGAFMVKLFPANSLGPTYIKAIKAPLSHIPLVAMGGITPENIGEYMRVGIHSFGISSGIFAPGDVTGRNGEAIAASVNRYMDALNAEK